MKRITLLLLIALAFGKAKTQTSNDILNLLIANKTITQQQADSIRAEAAIKQQKTDSLRTSFGVEASKKLKLSGFTQVRYQNFGNPAKNDAVDVRRARLSAKGSISSSWSYVLQVEFATAPKLLDAYAEYKFADYLRVQAGNIKIPLSLENNTPTDKLETIDLSQVVESLCSRGQDVIGNFNGLDLGVKVTGDVVKIKDYNLINYAVGVFNGSGVNFSDNNKARDIGGRLVLQPIKNLKIGGGFYSGYANIPTTTTTVTTTTTTSASLVSKSTSTLTTKTTSINQARNRIGIELSYEIKGLSFRGEYINGKDGRDSKWKDINKEGYYAQIGYFVFPKKLQVIFKYDDYDQNTSFPADITTNYIFLLNYNFTPLVKLQGGYYFGDKSNRPFKGVALNSRNNFGVVQLQIGF
ncbi:MAG: porin [Bacteroidales bacterium]